MASKAHVHIRAGNNSSFQSDTSLGKYVPFTLVVQRQIRNAVSTASFLLAALESNLLAVTA